MNRIQRRQALTFGAAVLVTACGSPDGDAMSGEGAVDADGDSYLSQLAQMYEVEDPPFVEPVRAVEPAEQMEYVAGCMNEAGWPDVKVANGGLSYGAGPEQEAAQNVALYRCFAAYPINDEYLAPLSETEYARLYEYYVNDLLPCLEKQGHDVVSPPTEESWLSSVSGGDYWTPYRDLNAESLPVEICPPEPPITDIRN